MKIVLFIGPPGSGKSTTIKKLVTEYEGKCHIFAPTNAAADIIGGETIYHYLKITPLALRYAKKRPFTYKYIIMDEIFMFNKLEMA